MARPRIELQTVLAGIEGVNAAWFQEDPARELIYPVIVYERGGSLAFHADNVKFFFKKQYTVTVIDRNPDSLIPDRVEQLPFTTFDRFFKSAGLNHFAFNLFF